jgi:hypothetical protein
MTGWRDAPIQRYCRSLIHGHLEAIYSELINQQLRLSFTQHEGNDCEPNLSGKTNIGRFIYSQWNAGLRKPFVEITDFYSEARRAEQLNQTIGFKRAVFGWELLK